MATVATGGGGGGTGNTIITLTGVVATVPATANAPVSTKCATGSGTATTLTPAGTIYFQPSGRATTDAARDAWMTCMRQALTETCPDAGLRAELDACLVSASRFTPTAWETMADPFAAWN